MAPSLTEVDPSLPVLRSISRRLALASTSQLPHVVSTQIAGLENCGAILSRERRTHASDNETEVVVHKFLTQITTLLQGRLVQERWAAAVLIKAVIDIGGFALLSRSKHWMTGLIANLRRPDPSTARAVYVTTIVRFIVLTWPFPSIVREITTPSIPQFVRACMHNIAATAVDDEEIYVVLSAFSTLVKHHSTIFRTFSKDIDNTLRSILSLDEDSPPTNSRSILSARTLRTAARLASIIHCVEPKNGSSAAWEQGLKELIMLAHRSMDWIFAASDEQLETATKAAKGRTLERAAALSPAERAEKIQSHGRRFVRALASVEYHIRTDSTSIVALPISDLDGLLQRALSTVVFQAWPHQLPKFLPEVTRDEKDILISLLPHLHISALKVMSALVARSTGQVEVYFMNWFERIRWLHAAERSNSDVRVSFYRLLAQTMTRCPASLNKQALARLDNLIYDCCADACRFEKTSGKGSSAARGSLVTDLLHGPGEVTPPPGSSFEMQQTAERLLVVIVQHALPDVLSKSCRTKIERTAILTQCHDLLLACTLYSTPGLGDDRSGRSLLPFLIRSGNDSCAIEALIRPRLPVLHDGKIQETLAEESVEHPDGHRATTNGSQRGDPSTYHPHQGAELQSPRSHGVDEVMQPDNQLLLELQTDTASERAGARVDAATYEADVPVTLKRAHDATEAKEEADGKRIRVNTAATTSSEGTVTTSNMLPATVTVEQGTSVDMYKPQQTITADESDDDDFVIPDLTMDVSDDDEDDV